MDWFGFHRSIPALVHGIDHPPMSGVGTNSDLKAMDGTRTPVDTEAVKIEMRSGKGQPFVLVAGDNTVTDIER